MPPRLTVMKPKRARGRHVLKIRFDDGRPPLQRTSCYDAAAAWREGLDWLKSIERQGISDQAGERLRDAIDKHLQAFTASHPALRPLLERTAAAMSWSVVGSVSNDEVERWLLERPWAPTTRLQNAKSLRAFGAWMVARKLVREHPLPLRGIKPGPPRFRRGHLTAEQIAALLATARASGPAGCERALIYLLAAYAGLRRVEVTSLCWGQVEFGEHPALSLTSAKTQRQTRVEVPRFVADALLEHRPRGWKPVDPVFRMHSYRTIVWWMRRDLVAAGLGGWVGSRVEDAHGRTLHLHALRNSFATMLVQSGATIPVAQRMLRHSSPVLTFGVYAKAPDGSLRDAAESLPPPAPPGTLRT